MTSPTNTVVIFDMPFPVAFDFAGTDSESLRWRHVLHDGHHYMVPIEYALKCADDLITEFPYSAHAQAFFEKVAPGSRGALRAIGEEAVRKPTAAALEAHVRGQVEKRFGWADSVYIYINKSGSRQTAWTSPPAPDDVGRILTEIDVVSWNRDTGTLFVAEVKSFEDSKLASMWGRFTAGEYKKQLDKHVLLTQENLALILEHLRLVYQNCEILVGRVIGLFITSQLVEPKGPVGPYPVVLYSRLTEWFDDAEQMCDP